MSPGNSSLVISCMCFPRVSGDEPPALTDFMGVVAFSPRERG